MAHYALLDENNIVVNVIVGTNETDPNQADWEEYYSAVYGLTCVRTSYNNNIRARFAKVGGSYNQELDIFLDPKPFDSWVLSASERDWVAPKNKPEIGPEDYAEWSEELLEWVINPPKPVISE